MIGLRPIFEGHKIRSGAAPPTLPISPKEVKARINLGELKESDLARSTNCEQLER